MRYDWETLCDPSDGSRVHVRVKYLVDGTIEPTEGFRLDGTTAYTGDLNALVDCGTAKEQYDYEDKIVYDNCEPVIQTIIRDADDPTAVQTITYVKLD